MTTLAPFVLALALGWLLTRLCTQRDLRYAPMAVGVSIGIGIGVASLVQFAWWHIPGTAGHPPWPADLLLAVVLLWLAAQRGASTPSKSPPNPRPARSTMLVIFVAGAALTYAAWMSAESFAEINRLAPHGSAGDSWMMWNVRARHLFRAGDEWAGALYNFHGDHPILLPAFLARCWSFVGEAPTAVPIATAALFSLATVVTLTGAVGALRTTSQGLLAGLALLGTSNFVVVGAAQLADAPLSFYILAATALTVVAARRETRRRGMTLALAGFAAGCGAWTKDEGSVFLLAFVLGRPLVLAPLAGWRSASRECACVLAGCALPLLALVLYKLCYAPPYDQLREGWDVMWSKLADGGRYASVAAAWGAGLLAIGPWALPLLAAYTALVGIAPPRSDRAALAAASLALVLTAAGYFAAYVVTVNPLQWQLDVSLNRVLLHLWPSVILLVFLYARTPEAVLARNRAAIPDRA